MQMRWCRTIVTAALMLVSAASASIAQSQLFFTVYRFGDPRIRGINLDGTNLHDLFSVDPNEWLLVGIDYDTTAGKLYWTNGAFQEGLIRRANLDGTQSEPLISGLRIPRGLAIDPVRGKLYFTEATPANNQILMMRANLDGSDLETIYTGTFYVGQPRLDLTNERLYFGADGEIKSAALDGTDVRTVVTGVSLPGALDLDIENGYVYWIDFDTHTDFVGRARLDNTEFTVLIDISPLVVQSSGLVDLILDRTHDHVYFANQVFIPPSTTIERTNLDGSDHIIFHSEPDPSYTPSAMVLDVRVPQAVADCNDNGTPDATDIAMGQADDCNANLIPDECEADPCPILTFLLDHGSDAANTQGFALGQPSQWEQFQPFDVPAGGWSIGQIGVDGFTVNYDGVGFSVTIYPDNGLDRPDETAPLAMASGFQFRFDTNHENWMYRPISVQLPEGRHWLRIHADQPTIYQATVNRGVSGPGSLARGTSGTFFPSAFSLAVRLVEQMCDEATGDFTGDNDADAEDLQPFVAAVLAGSTLPSDLCAGDFVVNGMIDLADVPGMVSLLITP